jgi:hypothetical protein
MSAMPASRPEKRLFPGWTYGPTFLWALVAAAVPALILGCVMPVSLLFQPRVRTPYELPAGHAVFVYNSGGAFECDITEHGDVTEHFVTGRRDFVPFAGQRVAPRTTAGATMKCRDSVIVTVDPDWRYTLANNQPAKLGLTFFAIFALAPALVRVRDRIRRRRRPVTIDFTGGGSGSSPRRGTWRRAGRRRGPLR